MNPIAKLTLSTLICTLLLLGCKSTSPASQTATTDVSSTALVPPSTAPSEPTVLKFGHDSMTRIVAGTQTSTTRKGIRNYPLGQATMQSGDQTLQIEITALTHKKFGDLTEDEAKTDGLATLDDLKDAMHKNYPGIQDTDDVTTIYLRVPSH